jgi:homoserine acetyltransferase
MTPRKKLDPYGECAHAHTEPATEWTNVTGPDLPGDQEQRVVVCVNCGTNIVESRRAVDGG